MSERDESENDLDDNPVVAAGIADQIGDAQIQAMARTLAKVLVKQALIEHGLAPANDNGESR